MEFFAPTAWFLIFRTAWFLVYHTHLTLPDYYKSPGRLRLLSPTDQEHTNLYAFPDLHDDVDVAPGWALLDPRW